MFAVPFNNHTYLRSLHYGLTCFEGMKAYKAIPDKSLCLFRPDLNMKRLSSSMDRLQMPGSDFDQKELTKCIAELVRVEQDWIPYGEGYSLYIRPTVIASHPFLGLAAPESLLLYVITSPVGPYFKSGFAPIRLTADSGMVRAWPGGVGNVKIGGNYAPTMKPQAEAAKAGYGQVRNAKRPKTTFLGDAMSPHILLVRAYIHIYVCVYIVPHHVITFRYCGCTVKMTKLQKSAVPISFLYSRTRTLEKKSW